MGAASSSTQPSIFTRTSLSGNEYRNHVKTKELKDMSDALFQFMYSKWDEREIFDIADNPGDYVIAISDLITTQFHVLGYTTKKNKIGEIYFERWDDLDPPKSSTELDKLRSQNSTRSSRLNSKLKKLKEKIGITRAEAGQRIHEQHAKIIAFYFIRIFQILGSLLLVVRDNKGFPDIDEKTGSMRSLESANMARAYTEQAYKFPSRFKAPVTGGYPLTGGSESRFPQKTPLGLYEFLRFYLRSYDADDIRKFKEDYQLDLPPNLYKFAGSDILFFDYTTPTSMPDSIMVTTKEGGLSEKQSFKIFVKSSQSNRADLQNLEVYVTKHETSDGRVLREYAPPSNFQDSYQQYDRYPREVSIVIKASIGKAVIGTATFTKADAYKKDSMYKDGLQYRLKEGSILQSVEGDLDLTKDFVKILEKFVILSLRKIYPGQDFTKPVLIKQDDKNSNSKREFKAHKNNPGLLALFNQMSNKDHMPHCVTRALDLLDAASINNIRKDITGKDLNATTKICGSDIKGTGSSYVPLRSVGQLFGKLKVSDVISVNEDDFKKAEEILKSFVGKESKSDPISVDELNKIGQGTEAINLSAALNKLSAAFHMNKQAESEIKSFENINLSSPSGCANKPSVNPIIPGGPEFLEMQRYSNKLLAFHLNNVIDISKFLKSIFNISQRPDGTWKVEGPKTEILFAGFDVLDKLTDQARTLLVNYYSGCEDIYQKGVKVWNDQQNKPANVKPTELNP